MAHQAEVLAAKPENPSSVLRTHSVEGENQFSKGVLCLPNTSWNIYGLGSQVLTPW